MTTCFGKIAHIGLTILLAASLTIIGCQQPAPQKMGAYYPGTLTSAFPNYVYGPFVFTATTQTQTQALSGVSTCMFSQTAVAPTTATFQINGSNDGGVTYYPMAVAPYVGSATIASVLTTITITTSGHLYVANCSGFTNFSIVTSGTFTGTSYTWTVTGTSNKGTL